MLQINPKKANNNSIAQQMNKRPESPSKGQESGNLSEKENFCAESRPKRSLTSSTWNTGFKNHDRLRIV